MTLKTITIVILYFILTQKILSQWIRQTSPPNNHWRSVSFVSPKLGWVVGESGVIINTTNGGQSWKQQESGTTYTLRSVSFCDSVNGWAVGSGVKLKTTNGGKNWTVVKFDTSIYIRNLKVQCITREHVVVLRDRFEFDIYTDKRVWKTSDGGITAEEIVSLNNQLWGWWTDVHFESLTSGWVVGLSGSFFDTLQVLRTKDGGKSFDKANINWNSKGGINTIHFISEDEGWLLSDSIYYTNDGGINWIGTSKQIITYPGPFIMFGDTGYIAQEFGKIYRTTDKGKSWEEQSISASPFFWGISFIDSKTGWAVGSGNIIYHTNNGGVTSINEDNFYFNLQNYLLYQNHPNPFNPSTTIRYHVPLDGLVTIKVFDILGREISTLVEEFKTAGYHDVQFDGTVLSSGIYFYKMTADKFVSVKKFILTK